MFSRSCATHTIARIACKFEHTIYVVSKHMCMNIMFYQTVAILRSGINVFYITNYLHELGTTARRVGLYKTSALRGVKPRCSVLFPKITLTCLIRSNHLRDLHGLVLAGRYFWVQNLGSSWCQASLFCTVSKNNSHSSNPFQSLA